MSNVHNRFLPDFLIIGAMKAGTTTLYRDLSGHPQVFLPEEKEPETLVKFGDDDIRIVRDYRSLFAPGGGGGGGGGGGARLGEASTAYTKRPDHEGVAERARRIIGADLKLIYLTRDPVARAVSHFKHDTGQQTVEGDFDAAVRMHHRYVAYSRYDWQLAPWIEAFGNDALLRIAFEDYVADRGATLDRVCRFIGVDPALLPPPLIDRAFNASDRKPVARTALSRKLIASRLYQRRLKVLLPKALRERASRALVARAEPVTVTMADETRAWLTGEVAR